MESPDHVVPGPCNEDLMVMALEDLLAQQTENVARAGAVIFNKTKIIEQLELIIANQDEIIRTLKEQIAYFESIR